MNERIRELAEQARINLSPFQFSGTPIKYEVSDFELEKFAELIVKECSYLADQAHKKATGVNLPVVILENISELEVECMCGICKLGKREWVGLTDEEHYNIKHNYHNMTWTLEMYGRAIEQALKDKNHLPLYADTKIPEDVSCKTHPDAPHGFDRNMSHSLDRYVCECEHWEPSEHWEPTDNETNAVKGLYKDDNDTGR